ncbi:MAG TPA: redoxin domain-containing protein [Actinomycetota bacterium]|nr:redoxin domain-containing protein [Actinomycetota bacterium]
MAPRVEVGKPLPALDLKLAGGESLDVEGIDGPVLFNFFASWCAPCKAEIPRINQQLEKRDDLTVVGVIFRDSEEEAVTFLRARAGDWRIVPDSDGAVAKAFGVTQPPGIPQTFFVSKKGRVVSRVYGEMTEERLNKELDGLRSP